jgi:phosphoribosylpyrophosphate synthetase
MQVIHAAPGRRERPAPSVRNLLGPEFDAACAALMRTAETHYAPDLLVGIRTGGLVVAEAMARAAIRPTAVLPLTCRRASTGTKDRLTSLRRLLTALPRPVLDRLRLIEHRLLTGRRKKVDLQPFDHREAATIGAHLAATSRSRVLVVDDAVDSGVTLATVLGLLRTTCPAGTEIRSAVITVTLDNPRAEPDFVLHRGILCRFPWSFDASR